jgi:hypothetical protein
MSTRPVICISSLRWPITITDNYVAVGCQNHPKEQWFRFTKKEIANMNVDAPSFYPLLKKLLKLLA